MWVAAYVSPSRPHIHVLVPKPKPTTTPRSRLSFAISSGNSPPPQAANIFGSVGRTLLTAHDANPKPKPTTQEEGKEEGVKQISGSDVLWALRKAAAKKNKVSGKKNKNKKNSNSFSSTELSSSSSRARHGGRGGGGEEDYTNVRPLRVKSEWSGKLDELEKQLQDLSHTK